MSPRLVGVELNPGPVPGNVYGISPSVPTTTAKQRLDQEVDYFHRKALARVANSLKNNRFKVPSAWITPKQMKDYTPYLQGPTRGRRKRVREFDYLGPIDEVYRPKGYSGKFGRVGPRAKPAEEKGQRYVALGKHSLEYYLKTGQPIPTVPAQPGQTVGPRIREQRFKLAGGKLVRFGPPPFLSR